MAIKKWRYKITTLKGLDKRMSKTLRDKNKELNKLFCALYDVLTRYNRNAYMNYRDWKWEEFEIALLKWSDWHNPIMDRIYNNLWVDFNKYWYISLYTYDKTYSENWNAYSIYLDKRRTRQLFHIFNKNIQPKKLVFGYPSIIKKMIVKWEYELLEKAIDKFCSNIILDFRARIRTDFITVLDPKLKKCIDESKKSKKEYKTWRLKNR